MDTNQRWLPGHINQYLEDRKNEKCPEGKDKMTTATSKNCSKDILKPPISPFLHISLLTLWAGLGYFRDVSHRPPISREITCARDLVTRPTLCYEGREQYASNAPAQTTVLPPRFEDRQKPILGELKRGTGCPWELW